MALSYRLPGLEGNNLSLAVSEGFARFVNELLGICKYLGFFKFDTTYRSYYFFYQTYNYSMTYVPEYKFEMFTVNPNPDTVNLLVALEA